MALLSAASAHADWTTYHHDNSHTGVDTTAGAVVGSSIAWTSPNLVGDVTAEPLYFNGVVYVATMQNYLYALDPSNGNILWADHLDTPWDIGTNPLPCGNDFAFIGIMGSPVIDPATNTLYAVGMTSDGTYRFWAIDLATHGIRYAPVIVQTNVSTFDTAIHNQRGALTFYNGQVYVPFGGRDGDCGDYHGWVFRLNAADGSGVGTDYYKTPALGAGMWARGGGVIGPGGFYTIATGNGVMGDQCPGNNSTYRGVNGILKLHTDMTLFQYWTPSNWSDLSCSDTDIGSTGPSLVGSGLIFQSGKNGRGYLINATSLGGKGAEVGTAGGISVCGGVSLGGNAYDAATGDIFVPCTSGLYGLQQSGTTLTPIWNNSVSTGAPIVIGGAVWSIDRNGSGLYVNKESDGTLLYHDNTLGAVGHGMVSPSYGNSLIFAPGNSGGPIVRAYNAGGTYSASYNLTAAPTTWGASQTQTFNITVTNTGSQPWISTGYTEVDLDLHFATSAGGSANQANWLTNQAFALPNDVAAGASVTVSVTVTAPSTPGSMVLEAEMIKEHQFWFQQWASVPVTVTGPTWSASYDMSLAPTSWSAGQSQTFNVIVTNTGNQAWPATGYTEVDVDFHFTTVTGGSAQQSHWLTSQAFALPGNVAPAGSATVSVTVTAPATTGSMFLEVEMIKEHQFWFTQVASVAVTVTGPVWSASYNLASAPSSWVAGQSQTFNVTVTNTGNQTWPATGYTEVDVDFHFTTVIGGSSQQSHWLTSQAFALPGNVAPAGSATVSVTLTAPTRAGSMFLEVEMIKEHQFWFTQVASVAVTVAAPVWSASYNLTAAPTTWVRGQSQTFNVTVTNTGNQAWPSTGYTEVDVDFHFTTVTGGSSQVSHWLTSQAFALPADVAPAGSVTVSVTVTAPTTTGSMFLEAEMIKEHQFWFTQVASAAVTVS